MKKMPIYALCVASVFALTACTKQDVGALAGGALGGAVGSQIGGGTGKTIATVTGTLVGAAIGGAIGKTMDQVDQYNAQKALENTKTGQTSSWKNPDTGNSYAVTPERTTYNSSGAPCRQYKTVATIDGKQQTIYGTACRQSDGTWQVVS